MKIAHYSYDFVENPRCGGGGAQHELRVHARLASRHGVTLYCGAYPGCRDHRREGLQVIHLGWGRSYLLSRVCFALWATVHSLFVTADLIVTGYSVFSPVLAFVFRPRRTVLEFYHIVGREAFRKYGLFGLFPRIAEELALRFGRNYLTLTESMAEEIVKRNRAAVARTMHTGYDETIADGAVTDGRCILYFGRIDIRMKGIDVLLDAFDAIAGAYPDYRLILAGRGAEQQISWVRSRIGRSPFRERVQFHVNVDEGRKRELFRAATFVCMPSRYEGWCISAVEAAACGKPTLGTDIMGLRDSIQEGGTGLLVAPGNPSELAGAMKRLLDEPELRARLGAGGIRWASRFGWESVARVHEEFYREVAGSGVE